ncbi:zona pellucida sperm-binding protein 4 precursor [Sus scrofa]|uniref:Zona pellucida sperm-binding protein 4 n=1 Tax=Sus scrofa TaxID=9823 RepID=ZP4_PIG|nr:zona pellucida sperm-binding protein 4 precursor [Sus scrofa]Q07287.1 RecName: Full=Zona pellucida sperm-binding protein 4; AltName: Full=Zona pellucida glycoprotein 3-alpha; Short=Zp-3-alpha; Short=Zp3-alpha; AltName: Full=Zona pellucida glycoprotein 4; Short=Zp-4; AltName: Full=Zona pellucida protein B; Contains: RecName: Full=Processed zona pellucida sperm-binding protein 4; Flags: Precursor [Sus scrofa]AAA50164.1 zp3-alpha sperm-binding glycoprotein [Sus scrofa]
MWLRPSIWLCFPLCLALPGQSQPKAADDLGGLYCGPSSFHFSINLLSQDTATPPALVVWDRRGRLHKLQNDSGCGTWVHKGPGSSMGVEASYRGCYVTEWDSHYLMPIGLEEADAGGHRTVTETKLFKCPVDFLALDVPTIGLCDAVPVWDRLPCAPPPITQGECKQLGCCYNSEEVPSCYYGNTVTSRCTQDGHFSIAVSRNVTSPPLLWDSVHLAFRNDSECKPVMETHTFVLFRFPFSSCGTAKRVTGNQAVYENELVAARDVRTWSHGSITRDSIFRLRVSCIYSVSSSALPVNIQVFTLPPPLPETHPGPLTLELQIAKDERYGSYYNASDYPVVKLLREPIYVEVSIRHRTDPSLGLHLHQCWATPGMSPLLQPQWPMLVNGCPYTGDNYQTKLIPVQKASNLLFPSHYQRFSVSTFSFVDSVAKQALKGPVYLHCTASVCKPAGAPICVTTCPAARRRRSSDIHFQNGTASISSKGPMILLQATRDSSERLHKYSRPPVDSHALWVAGLLGSLIIGALLVSYLVFRKWR